MFIGFVIKVNKWYIDSLCAKHMTGDKNKFFTFKTNKFGDVSFG